MAEAGRISDASGHFLNSLDPDRAREDRTAVTAFVDWFGAGRPVGELTGEAVAEYAADHGPPEGGAASELEPLRDFLAYCSRMAFTDENLVPHLNLRPIAGGARGGRGAEEELGGAAYQVTIEGLEALESELVELKGERPRIADDLHAAMADKDFRENAPLDSARDDQGRLEAKIRDIEGRLRHAVIIDPGAKDGRANVGSTVRVLNMEQDREQTFHLVSPNEVDPGAGKISVESPVGAAVIDHVEGDEVLVRAPSGSVRLRLLEVAG